MTFIFLGLQRGRLRQAADLYFWPLLRRLLLGSIRLMRQRSRSHSASAMARSSASIWIRQGISLHFQISMIFISRRCQCRLAGVHIQGLRHHVNSIILRYACLRLMRVLVAGAIVFQCFYMSSRGRQCLRNYRQPSRLTSNKAPMISIMMLAP